MQLMLMGYTGYCRIGLHGGNLIKVHLTSYSVSMNSNVIKSEASEKIYTRDKGFEKYSLNAVRDCPTFEISISIELRPDVTAFLLSQMTENGFHGLYDVEFVDENTGTRFFFSRCNISSFQFQVGNNSAAYSSISFSYFYSEFEFGCLNHNTEISHDGSSMSGESIMPYYSFGVDYTGFNRKDLYEFSFSFSHNITPKYGCQGFSSDENNKNAPVPMKAVFSVPSVSYDLKYILHDEISNNDYEEASNSIISGYGKKSLTVSYNKIISPENLLNNPEYARDEFHMILVFNNCYPNSYSPEYGSSGSVNMISISGNVYGRISFVI